MEPIDELIVAVWLGALLGGVLGYALAVTGKLTFACMFALVGANIATIALLVKKSLS